MKCSCVRAHCRRDLGNRMRVRFAGMFDAIKGMPPANPTAPEVVPFLDVTPCLKCTRGRYCSAACQEFTEQSGGYFEVERLVERGQACWQSLSERDHSLCDASVRSWRELARKHGHDRSMYALGFVHEHGRGVAQSDAEAQRWCVDWASGGVRGGAAPTTYLFCNPQGCCCCVSACSPTSCFPASHRIAPARACLASCGRIGTRRRGSSARRRRGWATCCATGEAPGPATRRHSSRFGALRCR